MTWAARSPPRRCSPTTASTSRACSTPTPPRRASQIASLKVQDAGTLAETVREKNIIVGVLAVPPAGRPVGRRRAGRRRRQDHLQLLGRADRHAARRHRAPLEPGRGAAVRALLPPDVVGRVGPDRSSCSRHGVSRWPRLGGARLKSGTATGSASVKLILWHGYLLSGTGSNIYTQHVARAWGRLGHDVRVRVPGAVSGALRSGAQRARRAALRSARCCPCSWSIATRVWRLGTSRTSRSRAGRVPAPERRGAP